MASLVNLCLTSWTAYVVAVATIVLDVYLLLQTSGVNLPQASG